MDQIKRDRALAQEQIRQIGNINSQMQEEINEEKTLIERFEGQIGEQRRINFGRNDDNLDLLAQSDALENHIRLMYEQNKMIEDEINKFIMDDDEVAQKLENRRSVSPLRPIKGSPSQYEKPEKPFNESFGPRESGMSTHHGTAYRPRPGDEGISPLRSSHATGQTGSKNAGALLDSGKFESSYGPSRRVMQTEPNRNQG